MPAFISVESMFAALDVVDWPAMRVPAFRRLTRAVAAAVGYPLLARVMLVELAPFSRIAPHIDQGAYAEATDRYHVALRTNAGCVMCAGDETAHMAPGEVWWFDKHAAHQVGNFGATPRVHLILDVFRAADCRV